MYCVECGEASEKDVCDKCSAKKNNKKNNILITFAVITTLAAIITAAFLGWRSRVKKNGIEYFYAVLDDSTTYYGEQLGKIINESPLLTHIRTAAEKSSKHEIMLDGAGVILNNDAENRILNGLITADGLPVSIEFFITDEKFILGSPALFYAEADIKNIGQDIAGFTLNNGLYHYGEMIKRVLNSADFSYSGLTKLDFFHPIEELAAISDRYRGIFRKLSDLCVYEQYDGVIIIGDNEEKCEIIRLTADKETILNWLDGELLPFALNDNDLKLLMDGISFITNGYVPDYSGIIIAVNDLISKAVDTENGTLSVEFYVYDGIIVSMPVLSATGGDNRLDRFTMTLADGNILTYDADTGEIKIINNGIEQGKICINWESGENAGDILIITERDKLVLTYPNENKSFELVLPDDRYLPITSWKVNKLENPVVLPENALLFKDMTIMSLIGMLGEYMSYLSLF